MSGNDEMKPTKKTARSSAVSGTREKIKTDQLMPKTRRVLSGSCLIGSHSLFVSAYSHTRPDPNPRSISSSSFTLPPAEAHG